MDTIEVQGGRPLAGTIAISGAKNAALKHMVAALLTPKPLILRNVPRLADVTLLKTILEQHGVEVGEAEEARGRLTMTLSAETINNTTAPYDLVRKMRASFLVLGPLVARFGHAKVSLPGGCAIGTRPVDLHLKGLEVMGAKISLEEGYVLAEAANGLKGAEVRMPFVSVGATETVMMAATLADGVTVIHNAAREPEIVDLADCLRAMGAEIKGAGTRQIEIKGGASLGGASHTVVPDRIETGAFAMAVATAGGEVDLVDTDAGLIEAVLPVLRETGAEVTILKNGLRIARDPGLRPKAVDITTEPFPGFPTDLQAPFMALMTVAAGRAHIHETIFENRFMHVPELARMGAEIEIEGQTAIVSGSQRLRAAPVMATDLRASICLIIAALAAEGRTVVSRVYHLDRGFQNLEAKLAACGADIRRIAG